MDDFEQRLLSGLPLAEAVLLQLSQVLNPKELDQLFETHRGRCYEKELKFATLVGLIRDALLIHRGSARRSFERAKRDEQLPVAIASAYAKLGRLPLELSQALLAHAAQRLGPLLPRAMASALPASLRGLRVVALDGKTIKHVARRLKPLRNLRAKLLGGKLAVAMDLQSGLALGLCASANGEANEVPLTWQLAPQVRQACGVGVLWLADRQFCDLKLPQLFTQDSSHFLVRYCHNVDFHADAARPARTLLDTQGRRVVEEWGYLGGPKDQRRCYVRRVTLYRPGQDDVAVVSDLLDGQAYPATDLLDLYLMRWGIERMFQQVTEVFNLRQRIGSTPQAMVFQASFCLVLYNVIQVIKAYAAQAGQREVGKVSGEKLFTDVTQELVGWNVAAGPKAAEALAYPRTVSQMRKRLTELLSGAWTALWLKSKPQLNRVKKFPMIKVKGGRISVTRALSEYGPQEKRRP